MFFGFDLKELFMFPFKDDESRKYFLVGSLIALAGFIIPILPYLVLFGYAVQIAKQAMQGQPLRMVPWDDWSGLLKDGLKLFGIRMAFSLPILIIAIPLMIAGIAMPFVAGNMDSNSSDAFIALFSFIMLGSICVIIPISIPLVVIIPAAEMHVIEKGGEFAAGFRFKEWWPILRANLGGFIAAFGIYYLASFVLIFAVQLLAATIILACLVFILMPAITLYITLLMYVTAAIAYRGGVEKLNAPVISETTA
ncbi:MAG TPA: DUF4013 domain-containing protein [Anaerolineales bacterium]|nr:DUF4013 domain-containing protein [Anaerolineales bacterium]